MVLTFRSSIPETFKVVGIDTDGRERAAVATRLPGGQRWELRLQHPSGRHWEGTFHGPNVLDALGELLNSKEVEYKQSKARGHKPEPNVYDGNRQVGTVAPITGINNRG